MNNTIKIILLLLSMCIVICVGIAHTVLYSPRTITFHYTFPYWEVSPEHKQLTLEIYNDYIDYISKVHVAEDSRSYAAMRFVFISEHKLDDDIQQGILDRIYAYLQLKPDVPRSWEVFFCENEKPYSAYVSCCEYDSWYDPDEPYSDWNAVPDVETILPYGSLMRMLKLPTMAMYNQSKSRPFEELTPRIPMQSREGDKRYYY